MALCQPGTSSRRIFSARDSAPLFAAACHPKTEACAHVLQAGAANAGAPITRAALIRSAIIIVHPNNVSKRISRYSKTFPGTRSIGRPTLFFRDPSFGRTVPRRRAETDKMDGPVLVSTGKLSDDPQALESPTTSDASFNHSLSLKALYRKLDRRIIPCLWILYFLASSSRSTVGLALTMNMSTGDSLSQQLGLDGHQISTGVALFYVGYVIFEIPSNLVSMSSFQSPVPFCGEGLIVVTRIRPHVWIARIQMSIGIVAACHAALRAEWSFYLLRFLLGACEAGVWPGISPPICDSHLRNGILFDSMVSSQ